MIVYNFKAAGPIHRRLHRCISRGSQNWWTIILIAANPPYGTSKSDFRHQGHRVRWFSVQTKAIVKELGVFIGRAPRPGSQRILCLTVWRMEGRSQSRRTNFWELQDSIRGLVQQEKTLLLTLMYGERFVPACQGKVRMS